MARPSNGSKRFGALLGLLPELLADYQGAVRRAYGKVDPFRGRRIERVNKVLLEIARLNSACRKLREGPSPQDTLIHKVDALMLKEFLAVVGRTD